MLHDRPDPTDARPHAVTLVFGEAAVRARADGVRSHERLNALGEVQTRTFASQAERDAFLAGVNAAIGWNDYCDDEAL